MHWAEPTFLDLLEYLTGWVGDAPLLLLCLARPELLDERPGWVSGDGVASLSLQPLSSDESQELVSMLGVGEAMWRKIVEAAEGNPLYAEQMAAMLADGPYADEFVTMPPTIHALLAARLDRLPPSERKGLERAAVTGKEFWRGAVVELTPAADRDQVGQALMALVRKDLIRPHRATMGADDAFRFAHALIRDAAYGAIPKQERAALHAAFANWLQANVNAHAGELEEVVGYHLEQAFWYRQQVAPADEAARGLAERAGELLGRCGQRAFARDDIPAAVNLLDRALALLTDEAPAAVELQRQLSLALWSNGEVARSEALLDGVIAAASAAGDRATEWYCLLERNGRRAMTDPWADAAEILEVCRDAVSIYDELGDDRGLARAWRQIATTNQAIGNFGAAVDASERALEHARTAGDTREESRSADALCTGLLYGPTPAEEAIHRCEDLLRRADGNPLLEANVRISLAGLTAMRGMFDDARATADSARKTYAELGLRLAAAGADQVAAALELLAGDGAAAERILRDSYDILRDVGAEGFSLALLADALYEQGRYEEAEELSVEGLGAVHDDDAVPQVIWRGVRAKLAARTFDSDAAIELANAALRCAEETDSLNLRGDACANLAETLRLLGRNDDAARAAGRAQVTYERKGNVVAARRASTLLANAMQR